MLEFDEVSKIQERLKFPGQKMFDEVKGQSILNLSAQHVYGCKVSDKAFIHEMLWHVFPDMTLWFRNRLEVHENLDDLPRIGIKLELNDCFEKRRAVKPSRHRPIGRTPGGPDQGPDVL